ncbi:Na(+) H(+) antiporter subunit E [Arcticibacter svalbardensis MN12-7]|uniref:Na(+) H(+) antiporter subunit E n=1 Tax=Arcticibacter svalbardensis MN12-7 TaxID=1150600 RepID=R9GPC0_9SPHI|nr:Na+/H+ antiporter subunit E [Arcticibacter svalbardensis]EOR93568.1 Na(+) H(+) antiporter subunit E [Arcticibacter svalbardensis MN12-7]
MNLLLSFIWVALTGSLYYSNFLFGFLIGFFILWLMNRQETDQRYFNRIPKTIGFILYFLYDIIVANIQVAYDVITPKYFFTPGIICYPLDATSDMEINLLSTIISLSPGTLVLDISEDKKSLYIHVMYLKDKEIFIAQMKNGFEKKLLEILR